MACLPSDLVMTISASPACGIDPRVPWPPGVLLGLSLLLLRVPWFSGASDGSEVPGTRMDAGLGRLTNWIHDQAWPGRRAARAPPRRWEAASERGRKAVDDPAPRSWRSPAPGEVGTDGRPCLSQE